MKKIILIFFILAISVTGIYAQKSLSLNEALQTGLKNNFDIRISRNTALIAKNNNTIGAAGYLPTIETDGGINQSVQTINQHYSSGVDQQKTSAKTSNYSAGIELDWTIFNGFLMFGVKDQLNALDRIGMLNFKNQVELSSAAIISSYFDIVRQQQLIRVLKESIKISALKLDIAKTKFEVGSTAKVDYLQAKVDMNSDSTNLLIQMASLKKSKENLKYLIGSRDTFDFTVADTIKLNATANLSTLQSQAIQQNNIILVANEQKKVGESLIKQAKSYSYPTVGLSSRYNFSNTQAQAGFILVNQALGLNYGATARWNIFEGGTIKKGINNAKINADIIDLTYEQTVQNVYTQLAQAYDDYISNNNLVTLVKDNLKFAVENLDIATERYKIGKSNLIDYRAAQLSYVTAYTNLFSAIYNAKNSEIQLMRLSGQVSKEVQ